MKTLGIITHRVEQLRSKVRNEYKTKLKDVLYEDITAFQREIPNFNIVINMARDTGAWVADVLTQLQLPYTCITHKGIPYTSKDRYWINRASQVKEVNFSKRQLIGWYKEIRPNCVFSIDTEIYQQNHLSTAVEIVNKANYLLIINNYNFYIATALQSIMDNGYKDVKSTTFYGRRNNIVGSIEIDKLEMNNSS